MAERAGWSEGLEAQFAAWKCERVHDHGCPEAIQGSIDPLIYALGKGDSSVGLNFPAANKERPPQQN
jgi:hypothetical protein